MKRSRYHIDPTTKRDLESLHIALLGLRSDLRQTRGAVLEVMHAGSLNRDDAPAIWRIADRLKGHLETLNEVLR